MEDKYLSIEDAQKDSLRQLKDLKYAGNFGFPSLSDANHVRVRFVRLVILQMVEGEVFAINTVRQPSGTGRTASNSTEAEQSILDQDAKIERLEEEFTQLRAAAGSASAQASWESNGVQVLMKRKVKVHLRR
jgi:hypothetical protein